MAGSVTTTSALPSPSRSPTASERPRALPEGSGKSIRRPRRVPSPGSASSRVNTLARPDWASMVSNSDPGRESIGAKATARGASTANRCSGPSFPPGPEKRTRTGSSGVLSRRTRSSPAVAVEVHRAEHPRAAGGVGEPLGLAELPLVLLLHQDQFVGSEQGDIVLAVAVEVADGQRQPPLDDLAGVDALGVGVVEPAFAVVVEDDELGGVAVEDEVGLAVAVEVAGREADDLLVDGHAHEPHSAVVGDLVDLGLGEGGDGGVRRLLAAQEEVDPRSAVVAHGHVVGLVRRRGRVRAGGRCGGRACKPPGGGSRNTRRASGRRHPGRSPPRPGPKRSSGGAPAARPAVRSFVLPVRAWAAVPAPWCRLIPGNGRRRPTRPG